MAKVSKIAKTLKTMTTSITGEELVLKINNAVWLILQSEYGITQSNWSEEFNSNEVVASLKLLSALLKANGHNYKLEDLAANTDQVEVLEFIIEYQKVLFGTKDGVNEKKEGK